jgi:hypothetical protein
LTQLNYESTLSFLSHFLCLLLLIEVPQPPPGTAGEAVEVVALSANAPTTGGRTTHKTDRAKSTRVRKSGGVEISDLGLRMADYLGTSGRFRGGFEEAIEVDEKAGGSGESSVGKFHGRASFLGMVYARIDQTLIYPEELILMGQVGRVEAEFEIDSRGKLSAPVSIKRETNRYLKLAVLRAVRKALEKEQVVHSALKRNRRIRAEFVFEQKDSRGFNHDRSGAQAAPIVGQRFYFYRRPGARASMRQAVRLQNPDPRMPDVSLHDGGETYVMDIDPFGVLVAQGHGQTDQLSVGLDLVALWKLIFGDERVERAKRMLDIYRDDPEY